MDNKKWYKKNIWIITLAIILPPLGLYLMWRHASWNVVTKIIITCIVFPPYALYLMWKYTNWHKNIKIGVTVTSLVVVLLIGAISMPTVAKTETDTQNNLVADKTSINNIDVKQTEKQPMATSTININTSDTNTANKPIGFIERVTKQEYLDTYLGYYIEITNIINELTKKAMIYGIDSIKDEWDAYSTASNLLIIYGPTTDENLTVLQQDLPANLLKLVELLTQTMYGYGDKSEDVGICEAKIKTALGLN